MQRVEQSMLSFPTDTSVPVTPIPVFYLHTGEHPFCKNPSCICHSNDNELKTLLLGVIERKYKLRQQQNGAIHWEEH
jgi:hypothetical protein